MPAFTYLSDQTVRACRNVDGDSECDQLLQELRRLSGEDWIIEVRRSPCYRRRWGGLWSERIDDMVVYTLYADCHGEWQIINLVSPSGGTLLHGSSQSREDVMNYMMGMINGIQRERMLRAAE